MLFVVSPSKDVLSGLDVDPVAVHWTAQARPTSNIFNIRKLQGSASVETSSIQRVDTVIALVQDKQHLPRSLTPTLGHLNKINPGRCHHTTSIRRFGGMLGRTRR
mmetsp:Transcript_19276/g.27131  ORF Transcript_19276/g.27131 Transcript_19276/m.27131 type:complete len:105 (-) Transcript_19276:87-401(-)